MKEAPPLVRQDHEDIENSKGGGRYHEEVRRDQLLRVRIKESTPRLRRWLSPTNHVLGHGSLGYFDTSLSSSPWIRGALQSGLAQLILRITPEPPNRSQAFPVRPADSSIANTTGTLFDARRSPFRALRSAARSAIVTRGGKAQPRAAGPRRADEAGRAATSSGPSVGGAELESQPAGLREIETTPGC
jgi:hypothetical protein